jgi:uncharacterized protein (TIGR02453 family)
MGFSGWPAEAVEFFRGLQADNTKAYWSQRKAFYEASVREPMVALLGELDAEFGPGRISRPYRDVRFRADKSPYKTEIYATLERGGYVKFSADGLTAALGYFMMTADQLERYRHAVARTPGAQLTRVLERLKAEGLEAGGAQAIKTAPRGYPRDHPRIELLRCRGVISWQQWPVAPWLSTAEAKDHVLAFLHLAAPLQGWLDRHVGAAATGTQVLAGGQRRG